MGKLVDLEKILALVEHQDETAKHIATLQRIVKEHENRLDRHEANLTSHGRRLDGLAHRETPPQTPTKRIKRLKGGWVNVYWNDYRRLMMLGEVRPTKAEADADGTSGRIACIQIPDIIEGEGLL